MRTFAKCSPYSSRSLNSCRRSYDRRSLSNVHRTFFTRTHSRSSYLPSVEQLFLISLRSNDYFLSPLGRTIISWGPHNYLEIFCCTSDAACWKINYFALLNKFSNIPPKVRSRNAGHTTASLDFFLKNRLCLLNQSFTHHLHMQASDVAVNN